MDSRPSVDEIVPHSYAPGFIVLSYLVSITGCWTTLELIHRKTSSRGYYNWYLLIAAAVVMGAVSVWCMHFIGNVATIMDQGQADMQIQYSPGFTVGSIFLPIFGLLVAFYSFSVSESVRISGIILGGFLTGAAICGMHYMGQIGIANYRTTYHWQYVMGSALIAGFASAAALGIFFYFQSTWTDSYLKRGLCAALLAISVSGMHWVATVGCTYRLKPGNTHVLAPISRKATAIVALCLSVGCCIVLMALALLRQRSRRLSADRAQQVVLACATFDQDGRLMVTPEGVLPSRKITNFYDYRSFDEVFDLKHPVFCWIFRASRCWKAIADYLPAIRMHLASTRYRSSRQRDPDITDGHQDFSITFKELFCMAANDLADSIGEPLENLGVLFGGIMRTGTQRSIPTWKLRNASSLNRLERGQSFIIQGRGQLLFLIRTVKAIESAHLQAAGHRFASILNVVDFLSRSMQVTREELLIQLELLRNHAKAERFLEPGVHLACFVLRPVLQQGFDVLVQKGLAYLLPTVHLSNVGLEHWQLEMIQSMDDWTVARCLSRLGGMSMSSAENEQQFACQLLKAIAALVEEVDRPFFQEARLVARPLHTPSNGSSGKDGQQGATVFAFRLITDIHQSHTIRTQNSYEFIPSKFFLAQQHAFRHCPDNSIFARKIHRELSAITQVTQDMNGPASHTRRHSIFRISTDPMSFESNRSRSSSPAWNHVLHRRTPVEEDEKKLVKASANTKGLGGIHIANELSVDVSESGAEQESRDFELRNLPMGLSTEVATGDGESVSFADELMRTTINERRRMREGSEAVGI